MTEGTVVLSKAERLDEMRCSIQQLAIDIYEYSQTLSQQDWEEYRSFADHDGLASDLRTLLERGSF